MDTSSYDTQYIYWLDVIDIIMNELMVTFVFCWRYTQRQIRVASLTICQYCWRTAKVANLVYREVRFTHRQSATSHPVQHTLAAAND